MCFSFKLEMIVRAQAAKSSWHLLYKLIQIVACPQTIPYRPRARAVDQPVHALVLLELQLRAETRFPSYDEAFLAREPRVIHDARQIIATLGEREPASFSEARQIVEQSSIFLARLVHDREQSTLAGFPVINHDSILGIDDLKKVSQLIVRVEIRMTSIKPCRGPLRLLRLEAAARRHDSLTSVGANDPERPVQLLPDLKRLVRDLIKNLLVVPKLLERPADHVVASI
jgi:hypothetical protein